MITLKVKKLDDRAKLPTRAYNSAGYDLYCIGDWVINPNSRVGIRIGISCEFPEDFVALIWDKGSTGVKGLIRLCGVIDSDYRGEWLVWLHNLSTDPVHFVSGSKVAQVLFQRKETVAIQLVEDLTLTPRGDKCLGSSGTH